MTMDKAERRPRRCALRVASLLSVVVALCVIMAALPPDASLSAGGGPTVAKEFFKLRGGAGSRTAGAACVYDDNGGLTSLTIRSPLVRARSPLPVDPATGIRFSEQWVGWRPLVQRRFDDVKHAVAGERDLVKVGRHRLRSYSPGRRAIAAHGPGIYRALVRVLWFDPRETFRNVVRQRVSTRVGRHFDPAAGEVKGACAGPASVVWAAFERDTGAARQALPVRVNSKDLAVTGHFDGDRHGDLYLFDAEGRDSMYWGDGRYLDAAAHSPPMARDGVPLTGDFDHNGVDDIFWYRAGPDVSDEVWWGTRAGEFEVVEDSVRGDYRPAVGDFDGDGPEDILWFAPGDADEEKERVWRGVEGQRLFDSSGVIEDQVSGDYHPIVGNFNGDCCADILWLSAIDGEDAATDTVWLGQPDGSFAGPSGWGQTPQISADYTVLSGDFDGGCCDDVMFVPKGRGRYLHWWGSDHGFVRVAGAGRRHPQALRNAAPVAGNLQGRRDRDEVLWLRPPLRRRG